MNVIVYVLKEASVRCLSFQHLSVRSAVALLAAWRFEFGAGFSLLQQSPWPLTASYVERGQLGTC